jgi:Protein of unknown function (DUF3431)
MNTTHKLLSWWRRPRRAALILFLACLFILTVHALSKNWHMLSQLVGMGDIAWNGEHRSPDNMLYGPKPLHRPGVPKLPGELYSKIIVTPQTQEEDASWIATELPDWDSAIYMVEDSTAEYHPPRNKGHEAMVYLSYIIDNYEQLPEIVAFIHSHRYSWHNEQVLGSDAAAMLRRLNLAHVMRRGYMNLRCSWAPGCPNWIRPGTLTGDHSKQEELLFARSWAEIFPNQAIPDILAQPCCGQFAVSRERIHSVPQSQFVLWRDWLLRTKHSDDISGRIWEYLWHVVFTGDNVVCPQEHICLCVGYGLCFGDGRKTEY